MSRPVISCIMRKVTSCVLSLVMLVGTISPAFAAGTDWNSVIRPGVNAGTGTADYSIDLFSPLYQDGNAMLFFNPRFRINTGRNDENEINVGLGYRTLISGGEWFVGGNIYFDTMESRNDNRYNQIGLGVEARSQWVDVIMNGYIVAGDELNFITENDLYSLNNNSLAVNKGAEQAMSGMDAEVGILIPGISDVIETRAYIGGYWWLSDITDDPIGVRGRIEMNPVPLLTINGMVNYDDVFDDVWRAEAYLNVPFSFTNIFAGDNPFAGIGDSLNWGKGARTASERMTDRVERDRYIMTVEGNDENQTTVHQMIYVDNSNTTGIEDGTLRNPWNTIEEGIAQMQDGADGLFDDTDPAWLFIFAGDHPYDGGHTLDGGDLADAGVSMMVWGEGFTLPGLRFNGMPVVDGGGYGFYFDGDTDTGLIGSDLTFRGIAVQNTGGTGLYAWDLHDATVNDNVFRNNSEDGMYIHSLGSTVNVYDNVAVSNGGDGLSVTVMDTIAGTDNFLINMHDNVAADNGGWGIWSWAAKYGEGNVTVNMNDNVSSNNGGDGMAVWAGLYTAGAEGDINVAMNGNEAVGNDNRGLYMWSEHNGYGDINIDVLGNSTYYNGRDGMAVWAGHYGYMGNMTMDVNDNSSNNNDEDNIETWQANRSVYGGNVTQNVLRNDANRSGGGYGIWTYAEISDGDPDAAGDVVMNVNDNNASFNYDDNIYIYPYVSGSGDHDVTVNALRNTATDSEAGYGIYVYAYTDSAETSDLNVLIDDNVANANYDSNIYAYLYNDASYGDTNLTISDNEASYSEEDDGIWTRMFSYADGDMNLDILRNIANANYDDNIYVEYVGHYGSAGNMDIAVVGNEASGGGDYGIYFEYIDMDADGDVNILIDDNIANGNGYSNIEMYDFDHSGATGGVTLTITDNEASSSESYYGIYIEDWQTTCDGDVEVLVARNIANGNYYSNIEFENFEHYGDGLLTIDVLDNEASDSEDGYGIYLDVYRGTNNGDTAIIVDGNTANGNYDDNIYVYLDSDDGRTMGTMNVEVTDNDASNSEDGNGIEVEVYQWAAADLTVLIDGNTANFNYDTNIEIDDAEIEGTGVGGDIIIKVTNNEANGSYDDNGIELDDIYRNGEGDIDVLVDGNNADGNNEDNIYVEISHYGAYGDMNLEITDNNASHSEDAYGIEVEIDNDADGDAWVLIADNIANGNYYDNIYFETFNANGVGDVFIDILRNQVSGAESYEEAGNYIQLNKYDDGNVYVNVIDNIANYNYEDNFEIDIDVSDVGYSDVFVEVSGNELNGSEEGYGLGLYVTNAADYGNIDVLVANNKMNYNDDDNMDMEVYMNGLYGDINIEIVNNEASWSNDNGFDMDVDNNAEGTLSLYVAGNVNNYNDDDGIDIDAWHYGDGDITVEVVGNSASHNGNYYSGYYGTYFDGDGIVVNAEIDNILSYGNLYLAIQDNTADWNFENGIDAYASNNGYGTTTVDISGNAPSWNEYSNTFVEMYVDGDGNSYLNIHDNLDNNYSMSWNGIEARVGNYGSGTMYVDIHGNTANMNDDRGIYLVNNYYGYADGIVEVDIYDNTANGNYCDGGPWPYMAGIGVRNYGDYLYVDIHDNVANGNYTDGIGIWNQYGTVYDSNIYGNQTDNNGFDGIGVANWGGYMDVEIYDNTADANYNGIHLFNYGGVTLAYVTDNVVTESMYAGIYNQDIVNVYTWLGMDGNEVTDSNSYNGYAYAGVLMGTIAGTTYGMMENNTVTGNYLGVYLRGAVYMDLGGGFAGSVGDNSLFGNTAYDLDNNAYGMYAENNWWGADADPGAQINGSVDYTPWLTSAP